MSYKSPAPEILSEFVFESEQLNPDPVDTLPGVADWYAVEDSSERELNQNTVLIVVHPAKSNNPVFCNKPGMNFNISALSGSGLLVASWLDLPVVEAVPLEVGADSIVLGMNDVHYFKNTSPVDPLILRDTATPSYTEGDETSVCQMDGIKFTTWKAWCESALLLQHVGGNHS